MINDNGQPEDPATEAEPDSQQSPKATHNTGTHQPMIVIDTIDSENVDSKIEVRFRLCGFIFINRK